MYNLHRRNAQLLLGRQNKKQEQKPSILRAGNFSSWLYGYRRALYTGHRFPVPCGDCDACCRASRFIHIMPNEVHTLKQIPKQLIFPAPLHPRGYKVLGYDEHGRCPMLAAGSCSIYRDRPKTCATFDCRILAAAGIKSSEQEFDPIVRQARRWRFSFPSTKDKKLRIAVQIAATFLSKHRNSFPDRWGLRNTIQWAILTIMVHDLFVGIDEPDLTSRVSQRNADLVRKILNRCESFGHQIPGR